MEADPGGLNALMLRYQRALTAYSTRITRDPDRARDIVQETFLRLHRQRLPGGESEVRAWLYTVCRNLALDQRRKERPMQVADARVDIPDTRPSASEALEASQAQSQIMRFLAALPEAQQEVIRLKFEGGLSYTYKEISKVTEHSVSYVGYLIHVGIKTMRLELATAAAKGDAR